MVAITPPQHHPPKLRDHALLMDRATFTAHHNLAVADPVHAPETIADTWTPEEAALNAHLRAQAKGRLEQEFVSADTVHRAVRSWTEEAG